MLLFCNNKSPPSEIELPFSDALPLKHFYFSPLIYAAFEIIINTNSHTRRLKLSESNKVLMAQGATKVLGIWLLYYEPSGTYSCEVCEFHRNKGSEPQIVHKHYLARHSSAQWLAYVNPQGSGGLKRNTIFFHTKNKYLMLPQLKDENWKTFTIFVISEERRPCARVTCSDAGFRNKSAFLLQEMYTRVLVQPTSTAAFLPTT